MTRWSLLELLMVADLLARAERETNKEKLRTGRRAGSPAASSPATSARSSASPGGVIAHGGATFIDALIRENLIDEYRLVIHPVAIGVGPASSARYASRSSSTTSKPAHFRAES